VMVARKYRIHLVPGHREEPECVLDMIPRHHVRATLHKQQRVAATTIASPVRP
jgi:hypothetical protein